MKSRPVCRRLEKGTSVSDTRVISCRVAWLKPNSEAGTASVSGAGFQPAASGKQFGKNIPQILGGN
jgi:hypothetical protein